MSMDDSSMEHTSVNWCMLNGRLLLHSRCSEYLAVLTLVLATGATGWLPACSGGSAATDGGSHVDSSVTDAGDSGAVHDASSSDSGSPTDSGTLRDSSWSVPDAGWIEDGSAATVHEAAQQSIASEIGLRETFCSCPSFVDALGRLLERTLDGDTCRTQLSRRPGLWECLDSSFGNKLADFVPGLVCELRGRISALTCLEALSCADENAVQANACVDVFSRAIGDCNLGSGSSDSTPPDLAACFHAM